MVDAFIGSNVSLLLDNGSLTGTFSHFDPLEKRITLKGVSAQLNGNALQFPVYVVHAGDIRDLNVLPYSSTSETPTTPIPNTTNTPAAQIDTQRTTTVSEQGDNKRHSQRYRVSSRLQQTSSSTTPNTKGTVPKNVFNDPAILSFKPLSSSRTQATATGTSSTATNSWKNNEDADEDVAIHILNYTEISSGRRQEMRTNGRHRSVSDSSAGTGGLEDSPSRRGKKPHAGQGRYPSSPGKKGRQIPMNQWADGDVSKFIAEEFDFQGNLGLFDKAKVFAAIRETDGTSPEARLVHLNRLPQHSSGKFGDPKPSPLFANMGGGYKRREGGDHDSNFKHGRHHDGKQKAYHPQSKLAPTENVLNGSQRKGGTYITSSDGYSGSDGSEFENDSNYPTQRERFLSRTSSHGDEGSAIGFRTLAGVDCPMVTVVQMLEAERMALTDTGPNEDQMAENAGRGICQMSLQALGGSRRIHAKNHNAAPLVVVLCGNNKTGSYGLAAARHLSNHGCQVAVCIAGGGKDLSNNVAYQQKILLPTGGRVVDLVEDLPDSRDTPVDFIIDGLLGYQGSLQDVSSAENQSKIVSLIEWANKNKAPVLSLDLPSGLNSSPASQSSNAIIQPKYTLCLGAPTTYLPNRSLTGEVFLADIGVPRMVWKCVGVRNWSASVFGCDYVVGLEYVYA